MRDGLKRWGVRIGLVLPFVLIFVAAAELFLRSNLQLLTGNFPCLTFNHQEGLSFFPSCSAPESTPNGVLPFRTNEDGFRDRPRAVFTAGAVAVLGDSHVEGLYLRDEETMSRLLENALPPPYRPTLNLGVRGSGPTLQALRLLRASRSYPLRGVIWVLNPTDSFDEIYFDHENPGYEIDEKRARPLRPHVTRLSPWRGVYAINRLLHQRLLTLNYILDHLHTEREYVKAVTERRFDEKLHCRSLAKVAADLRRERVPLVFLSFPHGPKGEARTYFGLAPRLDEFERLLQCARDTGAQLVDANHDFDFRQEYFWPKDWHLAPGGMAAFVSFAAPRIAAAFRAEERRLGTKR